MGDNENIMTTSTPATNKQIPDNAILDHFNKQRYLGNYFKFSFEYTASGAAETAVLYLANPVVVVAAFPASNVGLFVDLRRLVGETASAGSVLKVYLGPTISGAGAVKVPLNVRPANLNASVALLESEPTASANGSLIEALSGSAFEAISSSDMLILDAGQSLLVTVTTADAAVVGVELGWFEL